VNKQMARKPSIKYEDKGGALIPVEVEKITVDPRLNILELMQLLVECEKKGWTELISLSFDAKYSAKHSKRINIGIVKLEEAESFINIPLQKARFGEKLDPETFLADLIKLDRYLLERDSTYTIDNLYPTKILVMDKGEKHMNIQFSKVRQVSKKSPVGMMLRGGQIMPLDAVDLHYSKMNKDLTISNGIRPELISEHRKQYPKGSYIINADDIKQLTKYIYPHLEKDDACFCDWTIVTSCRVYKRDRQISEFVLNPEDGDTCSGRFPIPLEEIKEE